MPDMSLLDGKVGVLNLMYLMAVREAAARDIAQASYQFGLSRGDLEQLQSLSFEAVQAVASRMDQSMVRLRYSIDQIREWTAMPSALAVLMAAVRSQ